MVRHISTLLPLGFIACSVGFPPLDEAQLLCEKDADCPAELVCARGAGRCVAEVERTPPQLESVTAVSASQVELVFSEAVYDAAAAEQFQITDLEVRVVLQPEAQLLVLSTAAQFPGESYSLTIEGVVDASNNPLENPQATFIGWGVIPDSAAPDPIAPEMDGLVVGSTATLVWTARHLATTYTVEVATDPDFANLIPDNPPPVAAPTTFVEVSLTDEVTHYWRVAADTTAPGTWGESRFDALFDAIYVYCPSGEDCGFYLPGSERRLMHGSKSRPFRSVNWGVINALVHQIGEVRVAGRGNGEAYESFHSISDPVHLAGGYDPSFATRDPSLYPTILRSDSIALNIGGFSGAAVVEGLELESPSTALQISEIGANLLVRDVAIRAGDASVPTAFGVQMLATTGVVLERVTMSVQAASHAAGVSSTLGVAVLDRCDISVVAPTAYGFGLTVLTPTVVDGTIEIRDTTIEVESTGQTAAGVNIGTLLGGTPPGLVLENSSITATSASGASVFTRGVFLSHTPQASLRNNRISVGAVAGGVLAIQMGTVALARMSNNLVEVRPGSVDTAIGVNLLLVDDAWVIHNTIVGADAVQPDVVLQVQGDVPRPTHPVVTNNLLAGAGADSFCYVEQGEWSDPASLLNNALINCGTAYYDDVLGPLDEVTFPAALNGQALDSTCSAACEEARVNGNVAGSEARAHLFVDPDGPDNAAWTAADNDFHLLLASDPLGIAEGGLDTSLTTACGTAQTPQSCGDVTEDLDAAARTTPVSVGAYELD